MRAGLRPGDDASDYSEHPDIYEPPPATIIAQFKRTGYFQPEEDRFLRCAPDYPHDPF